MWLWIGALALGAPPEAPADRCLPATDAVTDGTVPVVHPELGGLVYALRGPWTQEAGAPDHLRFVDAAGAVEVRLGPAGLGAPRDKLTDADWTVVEQRVAELVEEGGVTDVAVSRAEVGGCPALQVDGRRGEARARALFVYDGEWPAVELWCLGPDDDDGFAPVADACRATAASVVRVEAPAGG